MAYEDYHPSIDDPKAFVLYRYHPSKAAAVLFAVLFSFSTILHTYQLIRKRTWYFLPLVIGGLFELTGYIGRILSSNDQWSLGPFIMQSTLLLVAPALFAASIYIILGRIILVTDGERYSLIRQRRLTLVFVTGDVVSFFIQGGGAGIMASGTLSSMSTGEKVVVVGLFIQIAFFGFFVTVSALFHYNLLHDRPARQLHCCWSRKTRGLRLSAASQPYSASHSLVADVHTNVNIHTLPWKKHIGALYAASLLILIRSLFRVAEYVSGNNGYLLRHEGFLYGFDAALMLCVMVIFNVVHPGEITGWKGKDTGHRGAGEEDVEMRGVRGNGEGYAGAK